MKLKLVIFSLILIFAGCQSGEEQTAQNDTNSSGHKVVIEEVLQAKAYTYLKVKEKGSEHWVAIPKTQIEAGETIYYDSGLEMANFESKDLQRTFESVYFVDKISKQPLSTANGKAPVVKPGVKGQKPTVAQKDVSVEPVQGGITIAQLFGNRNSYANKTVKIRGEVTKFNREIMGRNWVHIQDGSSDSGNYDLTVTTKEMLKIGDTVTLEGKIAVNKDFGAGYSYEVIMEQAKKLN